MFFQMSTVILAVVVTLCLISEFNQVNALTTGCINKNSAGGACCSGAIQIDSSVTAIAAEAFFSCTGLTSVDFTAAIGLTSIGDTAFQSCSGFTGSLVIPNSVTSIGYYAFYGCSGFDGKFVSVLYSALSIDIEYM